MNKENMIYLGYDETGKVNYQHHMPFHEKHGLGKTKEQLEQEGILVGSIPEPLQKEGKTSVMYYSEEKGVYYKYEDIPKTDEEVQAEKIQELENALLEMSTLQAIKDMENEQAIMELTMMIGGM